MGCVFKHGTDEYTQYESRFFGLKRAWGNLLAKEKVGARRSVY